MDLAGPSGPRRLQTGAVVLAMLTFLPLSACADSADPQVAADDVAATESAQGAARDRAVPNRSAMSQTTVPTSTPSETLPPFAELPRSAAPKGTVTALLTGVQAARHGEFERIVFEFAGSERPGYRVEWMDGPVTADGSGKVVEIAGTSRLRIVFEPASGVDLETGDITYAGENRVEPRTDGSTIHEVVRTGDLESVMTWVAGTDGVVPFRVVRLSQPTRLVVDVAVPPTL